MIVLDEMAQQAAQVIGADAMEIGEGEHASGKFGGRQFTAAGKCAHDLMVEQAVGQAVQCRRLYPVLLSVELHERDALYEFPGDGFRQHGARLGLLLAHDEVHLGRQVAPTGATHALQKARHGEGGVNLEGALEPTDIDAELERGGGDRCLLLFVVAHELLGRLAIGGR